MMEGMEECIAEKGLTDEMERKVSIERVKRNRKKSNDKKLSESSSLKKEWNGRGLTDEEKSINQESGVGEGEDRDKSEDKKLSMSTNLKME